MRPLRSVDMHAHVDAAIEASELTALNSVVFAACRSLDEAEIALARSDAFTVWGTGCHPGLVGAQKTFTSDRFREQVMRTAYVAELGLDGKSRVPMDVQIRTLRSAFSVLAELPRITSLHSYAATTELIQVLRDYDLQGVVLHWWLGDAGLTQRAVDLGCFFSVNASSVRRHDLLRLIPPNRILTETDHPFGDRHSATPRQPGAVRPVEQELASLLGAAPEDVRRRIWANLAELVSAVGCGSLLPRNVRAQLAAIPDDATKRDRI